MSIVNFCLTAERISVVTDTLRYARGAPHSLSTGKARTNGKYAIACRGVSRMSEFLQGTIEQRAHKSFDDMVWILTNFKMPWPTLEDKMEAFLFGFSNRDQRMRAAYLKWHSEDNSAECQYLDDGVYMNPSVPLRAPGLPKTATDEQLYRLALAHYEAPRRHSLGYCVGGVCHLTEVDLSSARQRIYGLFPDYDEMATKFGDPLAEEVASWRSLAARGATA